jgi:GNAT superfamily N-acetyltransferase
MPIADLARTLLDTPRWVETRFMLLRGEALVRGLTGDRRHFVAVSGRWPLISVVGRPDAAFISGAVEGVDEDVNVLCAEEDADHVACALPGWRRIGATVHGWPGDMPLPTPPPPDEARLIPREELATLRHVPPGLREELLTAADYSPVAGAFAGGAPVAFCCASAITETLWDIGIDTLDGYRRRGLARKAAELLIATLGAAGKFPVWGSEDGNEPSLALARKIGFVPLERLVVFERSPEV